MSLPFLRPSPPPSAQYMRSFLRSGAVARCSSSSNGLLLRRPATSNTARPTAPYSTASSPPSSAVPTGSGPAPDTKGTHAASAATATSTASVSSPPPIPPSAGESLSPGQQSLEALPFYVRRTASEGLPVYHDTKAGGTLRQTVVRKIEGDRKALRERLLKELPDLLKPEHVKINHLTGNISIKGHVARQVSGVLRGLHF